MIKSNLQVSAVPLTTRQQVRAIYQRRGVVGFFKGYWITLGVFAPYSFVFFLTYEALKARLAAGGGGGEGGAGADPLRFHQHFTCAATSASLAAISTHALEVAKTRAQVSELSVRGILRSMTSHPQGGGWRTLLTKGLGARLLYIIPSAGLNLALYEQLKLLV